MGAYEDKRLTVSMNGRAAVRKGYMERMTKETKVSVSIDIDGTGKCEANTPVHFLNHMLDVRPPCALPPSCLHCWPARSRRASIPTSD